MTRPTSPCDRSLDKTTVTLGSVATSRRRARLGMGEPLSPPSSTERWVSWLVFFSAIVLGWVLLWALGWSIDLAVSDEEYPAHAPWRGCDALGNQQLLSLVSIGLLVLAGVKLIGRAIRRDGWWQIGLWAGFLLIADALLMLQYLRFFVAGAVACD